MRFFVATLLLAILASSGLAQTSGTGTTLPVASGPKAELQALIRDLQKEAPECFAGKALDPAIEARIQANKYDTKYIALLRETLIPLAGKDARTIFVINQFEAPLLKSPAATIKEALPMVKELYLRNKGYTAYTVYSPADLKRQFGLPDPGKEGAVEAKLKMLDDLDKRRRKKLESDLAVLYHNQQAWKLESNYLNLLALAGDAQQDAALLAAIQECEKKNSAMFLEGLTAVKTTSAVMSADRAKKIHPLYLKFGMANKWERRQYYECNRGSMIATANAEIPKTAGAVLVGNWILDTTNAIARAGGLPQVAVPTGEDIDKHDKEANEEAAKKKAAQAGKK